jgi:hypothetical protein
MTENKNNSNKKKAKKAPAKKAAAKKAVAKKTTSQDSEAKKKTTRPAKTSTSVSSSELADVKVKIEQDATELVDAAKSLITSVSGVAPHTAVTFVSEVITANDIKSVALRKRVLKWFKRS